MKITRSRLRETIGRRIPFICSSSVGVIVDGVYMVFSYDTLICKYSLDTESLVYFNSNYYSKTTSTLQNIIRDTLF